MKYWRECVAALMVAGVVAIAVCQPSPEQAAAATREMAIRFIGANPDLVYDRLQKSECVVVLKWVHTRGRHVRTEQARPQIKSLVEIGVLPQKVLDDLDVSIMEGSGEGALGGLGE